MKTYKVTWTEKHQTETEAANEEEAKEEAMDKPIEETLINISEIKVEEKR